MSDFNPNTFIEDQEFTATERGNYNYGKLRIRQVYWDPKAKEEVTRDDALKLGKGNFWVNQYWSIDAEGIKPNALKEPYERRLTQGWSDWNKQVLPFLVESVATWATDGTVEKDEPLQALKSTWETLSAEKSKEQAALILFSQLLARGDLYVETLDQPQERPAKNGKVYSVYVITHIWPNDMNGCRDAWAKRYGGSEDNVPAPLREKANDLWEMTSHNREKFEKLVRKDADLLPVADLLLDGGYDE